METTEQHGLPKSGSQNTLTTSQDIQSGSKNQKIIKSECHNVKDNLRPLKERIMDLDNHQDWRKMWNPRMSMSFTNAKGLLNEPGDNNCFLNSAVQVRMLKFCIILMFYKNVS